MTSGFTVALPEDSRGEGKSCVAERFNQELNNYSNCCSFVKATDMFCEGTEVRPSTLPSAGADPAFSLKNYKGQHISLFFKELFFFFPAATCTEHLPDRPPVNFSWGWGVLFQRHIPIH